jgi:hypothetical protein
MIPSSTTPRDGPEPCVKTRETTVGWPLLTVETEAYGAQGVQMKGVLPWLVHWALQADY